MATLKQNQEQNEENILSVLQFRFAPYWPLFLVLLVLTGIGAYVYLQYATPLFRAQSTIMIKDEEKGVNESKMEETLDVYNSNKVVENEMEVLSSRTLMKQVVQNLHLYAQVYQSGEWGPRIAYTSSPIMVEAANADALATEKEIPLAYDQQKQTVTLNGATYPLNKFVVTPYGTLKFSKNSKASETPKGDLLLNLHNPDQVATSMANNISIPPSSKFSTVLTISLKDESPLRAKDVLNELMDVYTHNGVSEKHQLANNTLKTIEDRLVLVVRDLDSIERTIQRYKSNQGIVDLSEQGREFLRTVTENDRQATTLNMQLGVLEQVERYVASKNNQDAIAPATLGLNDPQLANMLEKLSNAELNNLRLRQTMGENSPQVIASQNEIDRLRPTILENVRNQRNNMLANKNNLASATGAYASRLRTIPAKERELLEISRQQAIKNDVYAFLLRKREETALSSSSATPDGKVIDFASASSSPVSPYVPAIYLVALIAAIGIGIVVVVAKEVLTGKILFRQDIEKHTQIPIVAEIVSVKTDNEVVVNQPDKIYISEQFRHLRAAMGLYGRVVTRKKLLVTSSIPGEGKSFVAANLAMSLAVSGKKVVLVDADIRGPRTSSNFGLSQKSGLANYLVEAAPLESVLYPSQHENLMVIPSGTTDINPTELLLNGKLPELFGKLERSFDYVIVDTAPVDPVTDAYVLSEFCDRTLFIVRHGHTPKAMIKILDENNKVKGLKNLAIVFNGVKKRGFLKGSFGYGYGFGYEYVYQKTSRQKANKKATYN